jgi:hypothetical protein
VRVLCSLALVVDQTPKQLQQSTLRFSAGNAGLNLFLIVSNEEVGNGTSQKKVEAQETPQEEDQALNRT